VVATYGRSDVLIECLLSIPPGERPSFRVVVVDQNESAFLTEHLAPLAQEMDLEHHRVSFRNASRARNFGAAHSSTPWLSFPDDDCRFLPDTLAIARERLSRDDLDLVSGQVVDETGRHHIIDWFPRETELQPHGYERCFAEATFFIRKRVFDRVHGFDPNFGPGSQFPSNEGGDMLCRLWRSGVPLHSLYTPALRFFHPNKDDGHSPEVHARVETFAFGEAAFTLRHRAILPTRSISWRLAKMSARVVLGSGPPRRRRIVYLRGFLRGALAYLRQNGHTASHASERGLHAR
jgi:GT2 family glycosyltransferase